MTTTNAHSLLDRIRAFRATARPMIDADGSPLRPEVWGKRDEQVHTYAFWSGDPEGTLAAWLRDAECLLLEQGRIGDVQRLDRIVNEFTGKSLSFIMQLWLGDFSPPIDDPDEPGRIDPVWAREGFHALVELLVEEAKVWAERPAIAAGVAPDTAPIPSHNPVGEPEARFWTREECAKFAGVKPASISKWVSEYRAQHGGRDPLWVRRRPGQMRGFVVNRDVYEFHLNRGRRKRPTSA